MRKINFIRKISLLLLLYICIIGFLYYSDTLLGKIGFLCTLLLSVLFFVPMLKKKMVLLYISTVLLLINIVYMSLNAKKLLYYYDTTYKAVNTQTFWYNVSNPFHRDILIHTLLRDKTAVVSNDDCWYYQFIEVFSKNIECEHNLNESCEGINKEDFYDAGIMRMRSLKDLLDDEIYEELDRRLSEKEYQSLFVLTDGFDEADKIIVIADADYNLYFIPYRQ